MPIYEYAHITQSATPCEFFEYLHQPGEKALETCPHCGEQVKKIPSLFFAGPVNGGASQSGKDRTADALRGVGLGNYAEAWEDAKKWGVPSSAGNRPSEGLAGQAQRARELASGHICSAGCAHALKNL